MSGFTRYGSLALSLLVFAGCAKEPQGFVAAGATVMARHEAAASAAGPALAARHAFAHLPDRGELIAYPGRVVRQDGAYTWHRTDLSEAHALHAIADGHLRVTTPSGQILDFQYDRHVEHPSGDWTWIGHLAGHEGEQAIVTFGADAAFGSIAQPDRLPLRLAVRDGVSWMVETDGRKVAGIANAATRPQTPDYFVVPRPHPTGLGSRAAAAGASLAPSAATAVVATATATTTVDLLLGYSPGFVADNGGTTSAALTKLNYLVDVANAAYVNSQIAARLRLVATMMVNYTDATTNDSTLEQLTGYNAATNMQTTPNAAFNALRAAREQYGADLVSMVRKFKDPENEGCGTAWLIGGGKQPILPNDGWDFFGYSVISDGTDPGTDGKTYYCLDETLGHELGHNMGGAHDRDTMKGADGVLNDPQDYGAFAYSFGFKDVAHGFYTMMAYGDPGQRIYRTFSNPRTTFCGGYVCGIADQADNARTLTQTIPIVATFRATVVSVASLPPLLRQIDVNGNGTSDLFFYNTSDPTQFKVSTWFFNGTSRTAASLSLVGNAHKTLVDTGDMSGDGRGDILYLDVGNWLAWSYSTGSQFNSATLPYQVPSGWTPLGLADINGNGTADVILRNPSTGAAATWFFVGGTRTAYSGFSIPTGYRFVGSGDFNRDGRQDLAWTDTLGHVLMSLSTGSNVSSTTLVNAYAMDFSLIGVTDASGDGRADLLFWKQQTRQLVVWTMNGTTRTGYFSSIVPAGYRPVGRGDFNGDGRGDLLFTDAAQHLLMALSNGSGFTYAVLPYAGVTGWAVMGVQ